MTEPAAPAAPEVRPVPLVGGGHLRASDSDRNQVRDVLDTGYAEGRLTREEYDERTDALPRAKTFDDLVLLTRDLVVVAEEPATLPRTPAPTPGPASASGHPVAAGDADRMVAVFSGTERKGRWRVRPRIEAYALFGGIDLDLREAVFDAPVVEISGFWCFGGLDVKVPPGVEVRDQTMGVFGGTEIAHLGDPQPGAPVLVIKGMTLFGGVSVQGPRPSRQERRALRQRGHGCRH